MMSSLSSDGSVCVPSYIMEYRHQGERDFPCIGADGLIQLCDFIVHAPENIMVCDGVAERRQVQQPSHIRIFKEEFRRHRVGIILSEHRTSEFDDDFQFVKLHPADRFPLIVENVHNRTSEPSSFKDADEVPPVIPEMIVDRHDDAEMREEREDKVFDCFNIHRRHADVSPFLVKHHQSLEVPYILLDDDM